MVHECREDEAGAREGDKMIKKSILLTALLMISPVLAFAAGGGYPLDHIEPNLDDKASLQRGAKTYMNYCLGCHSMQYQRYGFSTSEDHQDMP